MYLSSFLAESPPLSLSPTVLYSLVADWITHSSFEFVARAFSPQVLPCDPSYNPQTLPPCVCVCVCVCALPVHEQ